METNSDKLWEMKIATGRWRLQQADEEIIERFEDYYSVSDVSVSRENDERPNLAQCSRETANISEDLAEFNATQLTNVTQSILPYRDIHSV